MKTTVGDAKHDDCDVYIGRRDEGRETISNTPPGKSWGNPYTVENHSRDAAIRKFATLLDTLVEEQPVYRLHVRDFAGKSLGCWCRRASETEPACHGDVLAVRADHLHERMVAGSDQPCERGEHWLVQYRQWRECVHCGISGQSLSSRRAIDRTGADLWSDDGEGHRVSAVSDATETGEADDSDSERPVEGRSDDANLDLGFEADESAAHDYPEHEQGHAPVATQRTPDERARKGGSM